VGHCKVCEVGDFADPELQELIQDACAQERKALGGRRWRRAYRDFPVGHEYRKYWEIAMTLRAFRALGALGDDAEVLGVGAGHEATIFWLTRHVRRVFATDLYLTEDSWSGSDSGAGMLRDPEPYSWGEWNPRRLVVQHMNGLELLYEDESFDGVFSSSSIEHFGSFGDVRRSVEEIHRVLRPGGVAALSTEFRLEGPPPGLANTLMFDEQQLRELLLDGLSWRLASPLDTSISPETLASEVEMAETVADAKSGRRAWSRYPHVVLREGGLLWTSVHLALVKPPA
jgi:SAM-dependent methyltransferase